MINVKEVQKYCKEDISKIKNYEAAMNDTTQVWHCHHMTETWWHCSKQDLIENECYYGRKACELIFLTPEEHCRLHNKVRIFSEETRKKMSEAKKGKKLSEETRRKISEAHKGHTVTDESRKKMSESKKGRTSNRKGVTLSAETRKKISEARKGKNTSIFGAAFKEHYGMTSSEDKKLYDKEYNFYKYHGHFSWEVKHGCD